MNTVKNENSAVYYAAKYWSDIPYVLEYICENITGDRTKWWVRDFKERYCQKPFECALSLNCGNGWVERDLYDAGIAKRIIAFDYSFAFLKEAETNRNGRNISYFQADVNQIDFKPDQFDLVINVAALHHVQYINRLCLILGQAIKEKGCLVSFDYIGPERNQYPRSMWKLVKRFNTVLPEELRRPNLPYPHLPSLLKSDPTEAIHSNLILETLDRYFELLECHHAGGGIAYEILSQNHNLESAPLETVRPYLDQILEADRKYVGEGKVPSLFSYFIATPDKERIKDTKRNASFQGQENKRENMAHKMGGVYHFDQYIRMNIHNLYWFFYNQSRRWPRLKAKIKRLILRR